MRLFLTSRLLSAAGVPHGFSVRTGGVSSGAFSSLNLGLSVGDDEAAVRENHDRLREAAGLSGRIATGNQVHGDRVVDARLREIFPSTEAQEDGADALLALAEGAVGVRVADCVPVLLQAGEAVAAVHSGWRGTRLQIAGRAVRALQHASGANPAEVLAAIGPCIGRCCYEVSPELAAAFRAMFGPEAADDPAKNPKPHLDLRYCVERSLLQAGVREERIEQVEGCTSCDIDSFFSHRRDKGRTGRHLAFIEARGS
ncbi:MAG TPA: peptidoglycan editing factor PgeF [Myxococcales bacterium]|nr:peptidoglycan editing factor PgeF [Myxococcales bacterium]